MVKIELPKSSIDFEIGNETFTLSLVDTSRGKYMESFDKISTQEVKDLNKRDIEVSEYNQQQADLKARYLTDEEMNEVSYKKKSVVLSDQFSKRMKKNNDNRTKRLMDMQREYLDTCFGTGSAKRIYEICDESSIVFGKVIVQINSEIQKKTDVNDFYNSLKEKIEEMKPDEHTDKESTDVQKSNVPD